MPSLKVKKNNEKGTQSQEKQSGLGIT